MLIWIKSLWESVAPILFTVFVLCVEIPEVSEKEIVEIVVANDVVDDDDVIGVDDSDAAAILIDSVEFFGKISQWFPEDSKHRQE